MRRLTLWLAIVAVDMLVLGTTSRELRAGDSEAPNPQPPTHNSQPTAGNALATRVLATLERRPNIAARVRHQVRLGEHVLAGTGRYWQQGVGSERRTRLELQTQVAGKTASLIQIFDSRYLWTDRHLPSGRKVTRLDPVRLQAGLTSAPVARQGRATSATSLISTAASRGGLSGQLADLVKNFDFGPPRETQLEGLPVSAMIGMWKPKTPWKPKLQTDDLSPKTQADDLSSKDSEPPSEWPLSEWPSQLPHHVLLLVGTQNLFPYVIEHRRGSDAPLANSEAGYLPTDNPLARFELFEVQFTAAIDRQQFEFTSTDIEWTNETPRLIQELGGGN